MQATHTALLPLPQLSLATNIFLALHNRALIPIGQLCDNGFSATFSKDHITLVKQYITITGERDTNNGLYYINLAPRAQPTVQNALSIHTAYAHSAYKIYTKSDLFRYLHCAAFRSVISTWTKAIDAGSYTTWPGLTLQLFRNHLPKALATAQGHLCQQQQNVRFTNITATPSIDNNTPEMTIPSVPLIEPWVWTKTVHRKWHDSIHPQRRLVPFRAPRTKPCRWPLFSQQPLAWYGKASQKATAAQWTHSHRV